MPHPLPAWLGPPPLSGLPRFTTPHSISLLPVPLPLPCPCRNPYVVGLALTYFFIYVVRQGVTSWFVFYLLQVGGQG